MSNQRKEQIYPLLSVIIILVSFFVVAFLQMEVRRMGYVMLKHTREYKSLQDEQRMQVMRFAKIMRPQRLRDLAVTKLTLNDLKSGQIIHMAGEKIAVRQ